ncbi:MAG: hypothetical protein ACRCU5_04415 [Rhizobiaceae bacterium]
MSNADADFNQRILDEKRLFAQEVQNEAWADGISEGIEPEILASAGMETILSQLMRECGPQAVHLLIQSMTQRLESGAFHTHEFMN